VVAPFAATANCLSRLIPEMKIAMEVVEANREEKKDSRKEREYKLNRGWVVAVKRQ